MQRRILGTTLAGVLAAVFVVNSGCNSSSFGGSSKQKTNSKPADKGDDGDETAGDDTAGCLTTCGSDKKIGDDGDDPTNSFQPDLGKPNPDLDTLGETEGEPIRIFKDGFKGAYQVKPIEPEKSTSLWIVTVPGNAYRMKLDGDKVVETKKWTGVTTDAGGGSRTYVVESGLVVCRTNGHCYYIDGDNTPEGALDKGDPTIYHKIPVADASDRSCIVSYKKNKKRYLGVGHGEGNFVEFEMSDTAPFKPLWNKQSGSVKVGGNVRWGYSCYIDQQRLIYYGQWVSGSQGVGAVDLKTMKEVQATGAPNGAFASKNVPQATVGPKPNGSYAMNGDRDGNVYNGQGFYTMAFERGSKTVWGAAGGQMNIYPASCLSKDANCTGHASFQMAQLNVSVGPMSGLSDGRMIGVSRGPGNVYLMKLKDKKDISKGVEATRIAEVDGDPYMYTDFTGATLYLTHADTKFELDSTVSFDTATDNKGVGFAWMPRAEGKNEWVDIKLEVRCYMSDEGPGDWEAVDEVKEAFEQSVIRTASCKDQKYDRVDVKMSQLNDGDSMMNIQKIQITAYK